MDFGGGLGVTEDVHCLLELLNAFNNWPKSRECVSLLYDDFDLINELMTGFIFIFIYVIDH
jgi:hypothetical protein